MLKILKRKNLITFIENSIKGGDNYLFRNLYVIDGNGTERDILENGSNSCAIFVSWILLPLKLIKSGHAVVESVERDLIESRWIEIKYPKEGAVLIWEKMLANDNKEHRHIGFYVGDNMAISNDSRGSGFPQKHHYTYNETRKIEKILWHKDLD
jgi:hypothetical protein